MDKNKMLAALLFGGSGTPSFGTADKGKVFAVNSAGDDVEWKPIKEFKPAKQVLFKVAGTSEYEYADITFHDGSTARVSENDIIASPDFLYEMGFWRTNMSGSDTPHNIALGIYDAGAGEEIYGIQGAYSFTNHGIRLIKLTITSSVKPNGQYRAWWSQKTMDLPSKCVVSITGYDSNSGTFVTDASVNEILNAVKDGCCVIVRYDLDSKIVASGSTNLAYSPIGVTINNNVVTMRGYDTFLNGAHATAGTGTTWTLHK